MAGILSKGITLSYKVGEGADYTLLTNLQEIPELGNSARSREKVDVTTLADDEKKSIDGLLEEAETQELAFKFLHEKTQFETLVGMEGDDAAWEVTLPDGLKAHFNGIPFARMDGAGVSAALTYTLTITNVSVIEFA